MLKLIFQRFGDKLFNSEIYKREKTIKKEYQKLKTSSVEVLKQNILFNMSKLIFWKIFLDSGEGLFR